MQKMGRGGAKRNCGSGSQNVGTLRKVADRMVSNHWCMKRIWVGLVTIASAITFASIANDSLQAALFYPRKLVYSHSDKYGRNHLLWERSDLSGITIDAGTLNPELILLSVNSNSDSPQPLTADGGEIYQKERFVLPDLSIKNDDGTVPYIEDIVALPEGRDLFLVRQVRHYSLKDRVSACQYGVGEQMKSKVKTVDLADGRLAVLCTRPSGVQSLLRVESVSLELDGVRGPALLPNMDYLMPLRWDAALVYAVQSAEENVIIYVKGLFEKRKLGDSMQLKDFRCVFGESLETEVVAAAQEVYRCAHPPIVSDMPQSRRQRVRLLFKGTLIPSVAYYDASSNVVKRRVAFTGDFVEAKKHFVCSCTMIWNSAKFLREWVLFNSDLGVEKFFLYDNNSEDDIEDVVNSLSQYNVTRRSWPWVKTQEAGFSHCAVEAQRECTWILFTDVDEYLFPKRWLSLPESRPENAAVAGSSPLSLLIKATLSRSKVGPKLLPPGMAPPKVGQISFLCRNFGPSGQTTHPQQGLTQGYTCREQREQRHKSMIFFPALRSSLQNVIHHFQLRPEYQTMYLDPRQAVVNHYKFQAWNEFETKFAKRASTYVADWKEAKNLNSRDRPEGLGPEAKKPVDWETSHCQTNDTALRDYTRRRFGVSGSGDSLRMMWEL